MPDLSPAQESLPGTPSSQPVGHEGTRVIVEERPAPALNGVAALLAFVGIIVLIGVSVWVFVLGAIKAEQSLGGGLEIGIGVTVFVLGILLFTGVRIISPGHTRVVQFFGRYIGTVRTTGLVMTPPLTTGKKVSVRVRNFETNELKVNDLDGNPINIAAIVVWQVADTARASFAVEDYEEFVHTQAESALRHVATIHPYDEPGVGETSLRGGTEAVSAELAAEVAERITIAGIEIIEVRISSLAYAPEIAQAMLQRQQAGAVIAAREQIVEGAVTMVNQALTRLHDEDIVTFDEERKAQMVSNLLVVLCSESRTTPVINTGSLYA